MGKLFNKKPKTPEEKTTEEKIQETLEKRELDCIETLEQSVPGSDEAKKLLEEAKQFQDLKATDKKLKNELKQSALQHIGGNLVTSGLMALVTVRVAKIDKDSPLVGIAKKVCENATGILGKKK